MVIIFIANREQYKGDDKLYGNKLEHLEEMVISKAINMTKITQGKQNQQTNEILVCIGDFIKLEKIWGQHAKINCSLPQQ